MNLETKIIIYKFTPQVFTLTPLFYEYICIKHNALPNSLIHSRIIIPKQVKLV